MHNALLARSNILMWDIFCSFCFRFMYHLMPRSYPLTFAAVELRVIPADDHARAAVPGRFWAVSGPFLEWLGVRDCIQQWFLFLTQRIRPSWLVRAGGLAMSGDAVGRRTSSLWKGSVRTSGR